MADCRRAAGPGWAESPSTPVRPRLRRNISSCCCASSNRASVGLSSDTERRVRRSDTQRSSDRRASTFNVVIIVVVVVAGRTRVPYRPNGRTPTRRTDEPIRPAPNQAERSRGSSTACPVVCIGDGDDRGRPGPGSLLVRDAGPVPPVPAHVHRCSRRIWRQRWTWRRTAITARWPSTSTRAKVSHARARSAVDLGLSHLLLYWYDSDRTVHKVASNVGTRWKSSDAASSDAVYRLFLSRMHVGPVGA